MSFTHLHVRSGFSHGCGTSTPEELVDAAARLGMSTLALTDRDGMYGIPRFLRKAEQSGLSPIVGAEITAEAFGARGHVVLLADGENGYRSLCRLITAYRTSSENRRRPVCPLPVLLDHADGLILLTGSIPYGLLPSFVLSRDNVLLRKARRLALVLRDAFGAGNVYAEVTDDRTEGSRRRVARVAGFAKEAGLPVAASGEVTYIAPADHRLHDVLRAAANRTALPGPSYRPTDRLHLAEQGEMERLFRDRPEALANARAIAERCAGAVRLAGRMHMPSSRLGRGEEAGRLLVALALRGAKERYRGDPQAPPGREIRARLRREISCVVSLGFAGYFLLAYEAKEIARSRGVPVTGRGSAANSLLCFCLGLTQPEPFSNRLLFERFLHEHRADPPDIDLDMCSRRRDEVRDVLMERYASVGTAVAATAGTLSLRGAVRVAARALGHTPREIDDLARHVPTRIRDRDRELHAAAGWEEALAEPAMRGHPLQDRKRHRLLLELSWELKGRLHEAGTHLAGVIFGTPERHLSELVPLEPSGTPGLTRCQYDKDDLEYVGIPKLDLLGLRTHSALHEAGELASRRIGRPVNVLSPPVGDRETYRLIRTGRTAGIFQLESPGQMALARRLRPRRFADLVAQISLFRPGPVRGDLVTPYVLRRNGLERYSVPLPELDAILRPTYGVLIYQEQVLEVAHAVARLSLAEGDVLRRMMTKERGPGRMRRVRRKFLNRARANGVPPSTAEEVFRWIEGFAAYGFSSAHAASFAQLAYASAYARTHYPAEFFAGLLNAMPLGFYSPRVILNEARRAGVGVLQPDIALSGHGFTVEEEGRAIRVGLRYCKGLSHAAADSILRERTRRPFGSVGDLYRRTATGRDALENLIRAGFLDPLPNAGKRGRGALLAQARRLPAKSRREEGQEELIRHPASPWEGWSDTVAHLPPPEAAADREQSRVLKLDVAGPPLAPCRRALENLGVTPSARVPELSHGARARVAGIIECLQRPPTRSGRPVWFLLIEDESGLLQGTVFENVYRRYGHILHHESAVLLHGHVEQDERRGFSFLVGRVTPLRQVLEARSAGGSQRRDAVRPGPNPHGTGEPREQAQAERAR